MENRKNKEQQLRRALAKKGYQLRKSRARNWSVDNQLGYMIVYPYYGIAVSGTRFDLTITDVERFVVG